MSVFWGRRFVFIELVKSMSVLEDEWRKKMSNQRQTSGQCVLVELRASKVVGCGGRVAGRWTVFCWLVEHVINLLSTVGSWLISGKDEATKSTISVEWAEASIQRCPEWRPSGRLAAISPLPSASAEQKKKKRKIRCFVLSRRFCLFLSLLFVFEKDLQGGRSLKLNRLIEAQQT